jgi:hypothetical protein
MVSETRPVSNFNSIDLGGSGEVIVIQNGDETVRIETDDNLIEHVRAEVVRGTLELGFEKGFNFIQVTRLVFYVGVDDLTGLSISGSGRFEAERIGTERLNATVSGSGDVQIAELVAGQVRTTISGSGEVFLAGEANTQEIIVSGSGTYLGGDLCSGSARVAVSGSGDATVCALENLNFDISGSGSISYYGQPTINSVGNESGTLKSLGDK